MEDKLYNDLVEYCNYDFEEVEKMIDYFNERLESDKDRQNLEQEVNSLYDEYLQKTENRNMSYGEYGYTAGLDYFELENMRDDLYDKLFGDGGIKNE